MFYTMPRWSRMGAFIIDAVTINAFTAYILSFINNGEILLTGTNLGYDIMVLFLMILLQVALATVYGTVFYALAGGTFGKFFLRVHIVGEDNKKISNLEMFKREQLKWTLIYGTILIYPIYGAYCVYHKKTMFHEKVSKTHIL